MREATNGRFPRFMVWENVKGAFSSNQGNDFKTVLEEIVKIKNANATIPRPKNGKWNKSGCIVGDDFSIAWRLHDAQYWGVPQRRERIALVADFGGFAAPEILFEPESMSGDIEASRTPRERIATDAERGVDTTNRMRCVAYSFDSLSSNSMKSKNPHSGCRPVEIGKTLDASGPDPSKNQGGIAILQTMTEPIMYDKGQYLFENHSQDARYKGPLDVCPMLPAQLGTGGNNTPLVVDQEIHQTGTCLGIKDGEEPEERDECSRKECVSALCVGNGQLNNISMAEQANTLDTMHDQQIVFIPEIAHTLKAKANLDHREDSETYIIHNAVRRLTPLECERLQGFPDKWTDISEWVDSKGRKRKTSDSARYKALGNSIALPPWRFVLSRLYAYLRCGATMGSLFDGIGGFPLIWKELGGETLWCSEIEEFPIAVTKVRFGMQD